MKKFKLNFNQLSVQSRILELNLEKYGMVLKSNTKSIHLFNMPEWDHTASVISVIV